MWNMTVIPKGIPIGQTVNGTKYFQNEVTKRSCYYQLPTIRPNWKETNNTQYHQFIFGGINSLGTVSCGSKPNN